jgi:hypothetical protein
LGVGGPIGTATAGRRLESFAFREDGAGWLPAAQPGAWGLQCTHPMGAGHDTAAYACRAAGHSLAGPHRHTRVAAANVQELGRLQGKGTKRQDQAGMKHAGMHGTRVVHVTVRRWLTRTTPTAARALKSGRQGRVVPHLGGGNTVEEFGVHLLHALGPVPAGWGRRGRREEDGAWAARAGWVTPGVSRCAAARRGGCDAPPGVCQVAPSGCSTRCCSWTRGGV